MQTFKGRVVYDRKLHPFTYTDVYRIVKKVTPDTMTLSPSAARTGAAVVGTILAAEADLMSFLGSASLWRLVQTGAANQLVINTAAFLLDLLSQAPIYIVNEVGKLLAGFTTETEAEQTAEIIGGDNGLDNE